MVPHGQGGDIFLAVNGFVLTALRTKLLVVKEGLLEMDTQMTLRLIHQLSLDTQSNRVVPHPDLGAAPGVLRIWRPVIA